MEQTFHFYSLDGASLVSHAEKLQVAEEGLLRFGVSVDLDAEEVASRLPMKFALSAAGQSAFTKLRTEGMTHV